MSTDQLLVRFHDCTHVVRLSCPSDLRLDDDTSQWALAVKQFVKQFLSETTGWPLDRLEIASSQLPFLTCRVKSTIRGGKGGFGTLLKGQSRQAGANATTDFGACRDLQGRRLRHINQAVEERVFRDWKEKLKAGTATEVEMAKALLDTDSGVAGWHLQLPAWADVSASKERRKWQGNFHRWKRAMEAAAREKSEQKRRQEEQVQSYVQQAEHASAQAEAGLQAALQAGLSRNKKLKMQAEPPEALWTLAGDVVLASTRHDHWQLQSQSNFCTVGVITKEPPSNGCFDYYYECVILTGGLVQVGWATKDFRPCSDTGDGVGDCPHSWGYDGSRQIRLHNGNEESFGKHPWKSGDVIGCFYGKGEISFTVNGVEMGESFAVKTSKHLFPVISCNPGEIVELHLHHNAFQYAPEGNVSAVGDCLVQEDAATFLVGETADENPADVKKPAAVPVAETAVVYQTKPPAAPPVPLIVEPLDLDTFNTVQELEALGLDRLKGALMAIGIKCGGTLQERAIRLLSLKGLSPDEYPAKLRAKRKK